MWYERGEPQTSSPMGATITLAGTCPIFEINNPSDSITEYKYKGYTLDQQRYPTFSYEYKNIKIKDKISPILNGNGLNRTINIDGSNKNNLEIRIAQSTSIKPMGNGLYIIGDHEYFVKLDQNSTPKIESYQGNQVLLMTGSEPIQYQLIW
jgi:hypothetical protein